MNRWKSRLVTLEALLLMMMVGLLRRVVPMRVWSRLIGKPHSPGLGNVDSVRSEVATPTRHLFHSRELDVSRGVRRASQRTGGRFSCLDQACAGQLMLRRRGIEGTVVIGLAKPIGKDSHALDAHAWLEASTGVILGGEVGETFQPVTNFSWAQHTPGTATTL